jgi:hypothetical protein
MMRMHLGDYFCDHIRHDFEVGVEQVIAAHAGLAGNARGDDDDVGVRCGGVVVRANDVDVPFFDGHGFEQVEGFALGYAFNDIDEYDIGKFF